MEKLILFNSDSVDLPQPKAAPQAGLLKRLSARHHRLARVLAEGIPPGDAAVLCGYSLSRVSILQTDKAFQELMAFYAAQRAEAFADTGRKLSEVASTALDLLQDRLEDEPDAFSSAQLLAIATAAADRSGHGPSSTVKNLAVSVDLGELERIKAEALASQRGTVISVPAQLEVAPGDAQAQPAADAQAEESGRPKGPAL